MLTRISRTSLRDNLGPRPALPLLLVRNAGHGYWNPDWRADPKIPRSHAERIQAAKKYNLHPSDYTPFDPEDTLTHGDYPKIPAISFSERSAYEAWDYPELRRNFGEPLHIDFDMYTFDRVDTGRPRHSTLYMVGVLLGVVGSFITMGMITRDWVTFQPQMPKQYPYNDLWIAKGGDPAKEPKITNYEI